MKSKIVALSKNQDFKNLLKERKISNKYLTIYFGKLSNKDNKKLNISFIAKIKRRLRNVMNEAVKKISLNFNYSYLVIAKITMLNNKYTIIKDTLFADFKRIK